MTVRTRVPLRRLVVLSLGVALLGGCIASGGEKPVPSGSPSATSEAATPEPSASPTEVPPYDGTSAPQMPADMASDGHLGARAAATYFVEVRHWTLVSNDASTLTALCDAESDFCSSAIQAAQTNAASGAVVTGGLPTFSIGSVLPPTSETPFFEVRGSIDEAPMTKSSAGDDPGFSTEGQIGVPFVVFVESRSDGGWIVRGAAVDTR